MNSTVMLLQLWLFFYHSYHTCTILMIQSGGCVYDRFQFLCKDAVFTAKIEDEI